MNQNVIFLLNEQFFKEIFIIFEQNGIPFSQEWTVQKGFQARSAVRESYTKKQFFLADIAIRKDFLLSMT